MLSKRIGLRVFAALIIIGAAGFGAEARALDTSDAVTPAQQTTPAPTTPSTTSPTAPSGSGDAASSVSVPLPSSQDAPVVCPTTTPLNADTLVMLNRVESLVATALDQKIAATQKTS